MENEIQITKLLRCIYNRIRIGNSLNSLNPLCTVRCLRRDFHLALFAATRCAVMARSLLFRSVRAVLLQVSFGQHLFFFPWSVHLRATRGSELGMCRTWPNHHKRLVWMICDIVVIPVLFNNGVLSKDLYDTSEGSAFEAFKFSFN